MKYLLLLLALMFAVPGRSQDVTYKDKLVFLDSIGREVTASDYVYSRLIKDFTTDSAKYNVYEYFKSGQLKSEGTISDKKRLTYEGELVNYYENGQKKSLESYTDGVPLGNATRWHENGTKALEGVYVKGEKKLGKQGSEFIVSSYWTDNGKQTVTDGNGEYTEVLDFETGSGNVKLGRKDGLWRGRDGKSTYTESYKDGQLVSGTTVDKDNKTYDYTELTVNAAPEKGLGDLYSFVAKNFHIPDVDNLNGTVIIQFVVDRDGFITEPEIIQDLGYGTGDEAVSVVQKYPGPWKPGYKRGRKVRLRYSLPIKIKTSF